jgi:xylulokinase
MLPKDDLGLHLTGEAVAEPCDASGTGAYHLASGAWDDEVLSALDLDPACGRAWCARRGRRRAAEPLAAGARPPRRRAGRRRRGRQRRRRHRPGARQRARPRRQRQPRHQRRAAGRPRDADARPRGRVHLFAHADGAYLLLGVTLAAAGSLRWYRDTFAPERGYDELVGRGRDAPAVGAAA